jgi:hypothetical protein
VLTDRPNLRTTFPKRPAPTTTERPTTPQRQQTTTPGSRLPGDPPHLWRPQRPLQPPPLRPTEVSPPR